MQFLRNPHMRQQSKLLLRDAVLLHVSYEIRSDEPGLWFVPDFSYRLMPYGFG
jgi:hypothetical protein